MFDAYKWSQLRRTIFEIEHEKKKQGTRKSKEEARKLVKRNRIKAQANYIRFAPRYWTLAEVRQKEQAKLEEHLLKGDIDSPRRRVFPPLDPQLLNPKRTEDEDHGST